jgi:dephospho-CoA kinase
VIVIGLTGSIGMGKSTTARNFASGGAATYDADAAVHALYRGPAVAAVGGRFPDAIREGTVDRARLAALVTGDAAALADLEAIVHPLVQEHERAFLQRARREGRRVAVLDIPLLLETGGERRVDVVVVASAPAAIQRERVLARPGMTAERFAAIAARQMDDAGKRRRAHFIVDTGRDYAAAERQVADILRALAATAAGRG